MCSGTWKNVGKCCDWKQEKKMSSFVFGRAYKKETWFVYPIRVDASKDADGRFDVRSYAS